jgi:hypothetical protein
LGFLNHKNTQNKLVIVKKKKREIEYKEMTSQNTTLGTSKRKTKVAGTFVGGERTVRKVFKRWQCDRMHEKKTKTSGNFWKENKSWRVTGSKRA